MSENPYFRWAMWSGIATVGVPILWMFVVGGLEQLGAKDTALLLAWMTVLPVIVIVPVGFVLTVFFVIIAVISKYKKQNCNEDDKK